MSQSQFDHFSLGGSVDFLRYRDSLRSELFKLIPAAPAGATAVYIEQFFVPELISIFELTDELTAKGFTGAYNLLPGQFETVDEGCQNLVFIFRPSPALMSVVLKLLKSVVDQHVTLIYVPRRSYFADKQIQEFKQQHPQLRISPPCEWKCGIYPYDGDLLTMYEPQLLPELVLHDDQTKLFSMARGLCQLQAMYGLFPQINFIGSRASTLTDMLVKLRREMQKIPMAPPEFDNVVIIDRNVDMVSPMLPQLTYEACIHEYYGFLTGGRVQVEKDNLFLNFKDKVFADIRDAAWFHAYGQLVSRGQMVSEALDDIKKRNQSAASVSDMKSNLQDGKLLKHQEYKIIKHRQIFDALLPICKGRLYKQIFDTAYDILHEHPQNGALHPFIEKSIYQNQDLGIVLRLACLQCVVAGGFTKDGLDHIRHLVVKSYGAKFIPLLDNLEKAGLLCAAGTIKPFTKAKKDFKLLNDEDPLFEVNRICVPLSTQLVDVLSTPDNSGFRQFQQALESISPNVGFERQPIPERVSKKSKRSFVTLVVFIGGCTFSEVAALRILGRQQGSWHSSFSLLIMMEQIENL